MNDVGENFFSCSLLKSNFKKAHFNEKSAIYKQQFIPSS